MECVLPGRLSPRHIEIARRIAAGQSGNEIARAVAITPDTLKVYVSRDIYPALGVRSRAQLTRWWIEHFEQRGHCDKCLLRQAHAASAQPDRSVL